MTTQGVQNEWGRRFWAETNSSGTAAELFAALVEVGAPASTLSACQVIIQDELRHAQHSVQVFEEAGGDGPLLAALQIPFQPFAPPTWTALHRALDITIRAFCCGETVAVPLFLSMYRRAKVPSARQVLHGILKDEGRHRAFGWSTLRILLKSCGPADLTLASQSARVGMEDVQEVYSSGTWQPSPAEQAWGVMGPLDYKKALRQAVSKVMEPRFTTAGLVGKPSARLRRSRAAS